MAHLETRGLIVSFQSCFHSGHSTQTALLHLTDTIRHGIENNLVTLLLLFDYRKAFDSIKHESLLSALKKLGFSADALRWLHSYLSNRYQAVVGDQETVSDYVPVTLGVPQGSSPGPVLFLALINSLPDYLRFCKLSYILFADDLQLYIQCLLNLLSSAIAHMNEDSMAVSAWTEIHGLHLNETKTKAIIFGSSQNLKSVADLALPPVIVNGQIVDFVNRVKNLGVIISNDLTWNAHISSVASKVHGVLFKLRQRGWLLSREVKKMLVQALILPYIDYACLVYDSLPKYLELKVQRLQNASIRFIFNVSRDTSTEPYRVELNWLPPRLRRKYILGCQVYQILKTTRPIYLHNMLAPMFQAVRRSSRVQSNEIIIPIAHTSSFQKSFAVTAAMLWYVLPRSISESQSLQSFKPRFLEYLSVENVS